jgi:ribosomal protein L32
MAVPKRKTPKSKQRTRRSHHKITPPTLVRDPATGGFKVNHTAGGSRDHKGRPIKRDDATERDAER